MVFPKHSDLRDVTDILDVVHCLRLKAQNVLENGSIYLQMERQKENRVSQRDRQPFSRGPVRVRIGEEATDRLKSLMI